ncbi:MAG TPA: 50S ribosomal protein L4 [Aggregatilinea sp.]|uniref:50S ribosomal protein L4 n=1 Tax=Aggregatilinea sp. TaxID=2806333 RepID=UPI002CD33136|nr:50S ribosomal protein L4 [Aggregatilinea sp.]HML22124.1 50S ribosomal protein L4 [Aggregatilinea sp.]
MEVPIRNMAGDQVGTLELPADIFEVEVNTGLMHQAYVRQMANGRLGTHNTKDRSDIDRTKAKWYRQKGTGRARHGARSAPIFVGGGVAHGPHPRRYTQSMPRKMRRQALRSALSALAADQQIVVVDELAMDAPKTQAMRDTLRQLVGESTALVLVADRNEPVERSIRNLSNARSLRASYLNIRDLLAYDYVIIPQAALDVIVSLLGNQKAAEGAEA